MPVSAIINPGGIIHHHNPLAAAAAEFASCKICPHVGIDGSPNPRKLRAASPNIAPGTAIAILANVKGSSCGMTCLYNILISDSPINFAAFNVLKVFYLEGQASGDFCRPNPPKNYEESCNEEYAPSNYD